MDRLRSATRNLHATPFRASTATSFTPLDLDKREFVLVRHDTICQPLQSPYDGSYKIVRQPGTDTVSTDRVKPDAKPISPPTQRPAADGDVNTIYQLQPNSYSPHKIRPSCVLA
ncbi:unnamed protein product [Schistocephalus solidus]|uniref:Uncharacterized protein n=1 Tax=Schistocephalus solidus TaxID=70667 RepID=A0A183TFE9_SCHSO|nr:unnamed protein product [Schistocephalus solidus]